MMALVMSYSILSSVSLVHNTDTIRFGTLINQHKDFNIIKKNKNLDIIENASNLNEIKNPEDINEVERSV